MKNLLVCVLAAASAVALLSVCPCLGAVSPAHLDDTWIEVQTANFVVFSNASEDLAGRIGLNLETLRQVLSTLQPDRKVKSPRPTLVYVFKNRESFEPYKNRYRGAASAVEGLFIEDRDANFVALNALRGNLTTRVVFHEYLHFFLSNNLPHSPAWFDEGIAEYFSTFELEGQEAVIGKPLMRHSQTLMSQPYMSMERLFSVTRDSAEYNEEDKSSVFYAQSWLLIHYVYGGNPELRPQLDSVVERLRGTAEAAETFQKIFEKDLVTLQKDLEAYRADGSFPRNTISFEDLDVDTRTSVKPMSKRDYLSRLGDLLVRTRPDDFGLATSCFKKALELDPKHAASHRGLGLVMERKKQYDEADLHYRKAIELAPDDFLAAKRLGESHLERATQTSGEIDPTLLSEAVRWLKRSASLAPSDSLVGDLYGKALMVQKQCDPGIAVLTRRLEATSRGAEVAHDLAILLGSCGRLAEAWKIAHESLQGTTLAELSKSATDSLFGIEWESARQAVDAGRFEDAVTKLEGLLGRLSDPVHRATVTAEATRIKTHVEYNRLVEQYNEGVDLMNRGRYEEAARVLGKVEQNPHDKHLQDAAQQLLARLKPLLAR